ncbi:guanylate kinase [Mogibacterium neglectum]|uniref:guanylate kinase n=1 Tax=Mogibacterium neglectum TaxID=114528 RepID=UPI00272AC309|nr:guanylate kinase [Mogibacterium neglectum]WLD75977.1 guanylate kinase [Mogibacterium neglectum]
MGKSSHNDGRLFVISGPSGAGKGTICKKLLESVDISLSTSMTTRAPRQGEVDGKDYYFVTVNEFEEKIANGGMLEYARVFDNIYGTPKDMVIKQLERGRDVILEIDVQGGLQIKQKMPEQAVLVFILPPDFATLRQRIIDRGTETKEVIDKRFNEAINEIKLIGEYDYYVVNDELDDAVYELKAIIMAERRRVPNKIMPIVREYERGIQEENHHDVISSN